MNPMISDADVRMIEERSRTYAQAVQDNDAVRATSLFTKDAVRCPPNQPTVQGREQMERWLDALPKRRVFKTHPVDIQGVADLAYARGTYQQEMIIDGDPVADSGTYLEIWRKQPDGNWYIAALSHNSDSFDLMSRFLGAMNLAPR